jgi:diguanylate cyclase (GGDEF)-like protein/PAS domain S-box-containing protein
MISNDLQISILQLLATALCVGILLVVNLQYLYLSFRRRDGLYFSQLALGFLGLVFVAAHLLNLIVGGVLMNAPAGMQIHRIEQVAANYFIFMLPFFLLYLLKLNKTWQSINRIIAYSMFIIACALTVIAFVDPDSFISVTRQTSSLKKFDALNGRGEAGIAVLVRDIILGAIIVYGLVCCAVDMLMNKRAREIIIPMIGIIIASLTGIIDILFVHSKIFVGLFSNIMFSRFSIGITAFVILSMYELTRKYIEQTRKIEETFQELDSTYRMLHHREERFQQFADSIDQIFMLFDYRNNVMLYISSAYEKLTGLKLNNIYQPPNMWFEHVHPDDRKDLIALFARDVILDRFEAEFRFIRPDGETHWFRQQVKSIRDRNGEIYQLASVVEDITDRKKSEEELIFVAYNDVMTGLPNRDSFFSSLKQIIKRSERGDRITSRAVIIIDINHFKDFNDIFGHSFGDTLIRETAKRLKACLRESDFVSRMGGDKFAILLNQVTEDIDAAVVARKINKEMSLPFIIEGREIHINLKIGISIFPKDGKSADTLVKNAEMALFAAKGHSLLYEFYCDEMNLRARERQSIEKNLRQAMSRNELSLHYQPLVDRMGKIIGMEALLRWNHPELGNVPPDKFIPVAESTGMIIDIGTWTLQTACRQKKSWEEMGYQNLKVSVNLSTKQLMDEELVGNIKEILEENRLDSRGLELEITESCIMENPDLAVMKINDLNTIGVNFSIDDFGTGYSSLSYLTRFKVENLKVDKSFIMDIKVDVNNAEITKAIIAMAHSLSLKVTAEGVETMDQMEFLKAHNCDLLQGYLFCRPMPADDITRLLEKGMYIMKG